MKADLMEKMLDAGFTKEEIFRIIEPAAAPEKEPTAAPEKEPTAAPEKEPTAAPEKEPTAAPEKEPAAAPEKEPAAPTDETEKRLAGMEKAISDLIKTLQIENIKKDSFGGAPDSLDEQTDRIMSSIIRPETKRKDD